MKHDEVYRYEEWFTTALVQDDDGRIAGAVDAQHPRRLDGAVRRQGRDPRHRRQRPDLRPDHERADLHRRRDRDGLPHRRAADGHGDDPVPPDHARGARAADHRGRARRGRPPLQRRRASASWRSTRRTRWSSPRATWSRAPSRPRSTRAAASPTAPSRSTSRSCRASASTRRCARSSTSAATSPASTSPSEPIHIKPGNHYVMGGVKTDIDGQTADPRPLRGRRVRLRLGARRQPARRQLAARHARLRPPLGRARRRGRQGHAACPSRRSAQLDDEERAIDADRRRATAAAGACPRSRPSWAQTMDKYVAVFRDEDGLHERARDRPAPQGGGQDGRDRRQGHASSTRTCSGALELQFMLDNAECIVVSARSSARRAAAPSSAPTSRSATTTSGSSTSTSTRQRRRARDLLLRGHHDPVGAPGEDVLS